MTRPGDGVRAIAARVFQPETMESVIDPIVADLQCEYGDVLMRKGQWPARLTLVRSYAGLAGAVIRLGARYICDPRSANPGSEVARTWMVSIAGLRHLHSRPRAAGPLEFSMVGRRCLLWRGSFPHSGAAGIALEHPRRALRRGVARWARERNPTPGGCGRCLDSLSYSRSWYWACWSGPSRKPTRRFAR